ncbi:MAG: hypothetical protein A3K19_04110 [Lentisphaerae bacterium RIFOXYB12_FULL_65_16]|nr:MAG: hypothetical protein A3K18_08275 [Lentisphaerae bacterium RIFOXYA12_64_32]OGV84270.1 MAG: hypothetical protein A3K19_04110 [Lentisphaerae bacterium RIFOXYB12_FULL_65_16]
MDVVYLGILAAGILVAAGWAGGIRPSVLCLVSAWLALGVFRAARRGYGGRPAQPGVLLLALVGLTAAWLLATAVPLPASVLNRAGETRAAITSRAAAAIDTATGLGWTLPARGGFSLSLNRAGTLRTLALFLAVCAAASLSACLIHPHRRRLLGFLVAFGVAQAGAACFSRYGAPATRLWWVFDVGGAATFGSFINPNHLGGLLAMLTPACIALAAVEMQNRHWRWAAVWMSALVVLVVGIVASQSRGAFILLAVALVVSAAMVSRRASRTAGVAITLLLCLGLLVFSAIDLPRIDTELRSLKESRLDSRIDVWREAGRVWRDFPLVGVGAEGFRTVSRAYDTGAFGYTAHHAESTYLQILADGGIAGVLLALLLAAAFAVCAVRSYRAGHVHDPEFTAVMGGVSVALVHGLFDVPIHVLPYALVLAALAGMLAALRRPNASGSGPRVTPWRPLVVAAAIPAPLMLCVWLLCGRDMGERDRYAFVAAAAPTQLLDNLRWTPAYWANWYYLGCAATATRDADRSRFVFGERCLTRATEMDPGNAHAWQNLAVLRRRLGDEPGTAAAVARYRELGPPPVPAPEEDQTTPENAAPPSP